MKNMFFTLLVLATFNSLLAQKKDSAVIRQISNHILTNHACYEDLRYLCKHIGHRLSGSPQAEQAVAWGKKVLEDAGCDKVFLQEVMVPHWVRGKEEAYVLTPQGKKIPMVISSLGNAVGTGERGLHATLIKVDHVDELKRLTRKDVEGKIVFFNYRFDQTNINTFNSYGPCVYYRWGAPSEAAKLGAAGVVIRSVSSAFDDKPHTGSMRYDKKYPAIPAVSIGNTEADKLEAMFKEKKSPEFYMKTTCEMLADVKSYNVVGEFTGSSMPKEIIVFGGHLDSWDIGEGAHDDGAGVVQAIEVMRTFKQLSIRPKRTIRAVLFMNEENGLRGGVRYAELAEQHAENHILAIESDAGGGTPFGFSMSMDPIKRKKIQSWAEIFRPYNIYNFEEEGGGADISPLKNKFKTPVMELLPDSQRYFDMHHSANDVFENVHRRELCLGAVAMAAMVYMVSEYGL